MSAVLSWESVCNLDDLVPGAGVAICLDGVAYAIFYLPEHPQQVFVVGHKDPFSGAEVLGWGLVCEDQGRYSVASPLYKQHFDLLDGTCLEDPSISIEVLKARIENGAVLVERT